MYPTALCQSWSRFRFQHIYFLFSPLLLTTRANNFRVVKIEALTDIILNFSSGIKTNMCIILQNFLISEPLYFLKVCPIFQLSQQMSSKIMLIKVKINFLSDFIAIINSECPNWNFNINRVLMYNVHTKISSE